MFDTFVSGHVCCMEIAGVEVPPGTAAQLAMLLSRAGYAELAMRVGLAVDTNLASVSLNARERSDVLRSLEDCPTALLPIRSALV